MCQDFHLGLEASTEATRNKIKEPIYRPEKDLTKFAILDEYHDILYELLIGTMGVDEVSAKKRSHC